MSWGLLGGLGQGMQQAGAAMEERAKQQRIQEWQQQMRQDDRNWQNQNRLEDREYQTGIRAEDLARQDAQTAADREFRAGESELERQNRLAIAGMSRGANAAATNPQLKALETQLTHYRGILQHRDLTDQEQQDMDNTFRMYQLMSGTAPIQPVTGGQAPSTEAAQRPRDDDQAVAARQPPDLDTAVNTLSQFNQGQGLLGRTNPGSGGDWQRQNEEHQRLKPVIESVRRNLKAGFPMDREEYQEVYHLLSPEERRKLDRMQSQRGRQPTSGQAPISNVIFPQYNN